jgi:hypothetical protein
VTKYRTLALSTEEMEEHPAVREWHRATGLDGTPESIHVFREDAHTQVYRIRGLGPARGDVFAKHVSSEKIETERTVYERILPHLPLTTPRYYGSLVDGALGWVFLEDVGEERYSRDDPEHLALAARWVATLHTLAADIPDAPSLPDGGPTRYLEHLRSGRRKILSTLETWPYPPGELKVLASLLRELDAVEHRWPWVEASCRGAPQTVVHGDFRPKNAYLRRNGRGLSLFPIDWETGGFGPPMLDLRKIDLETYASLVREAWPEVGSETVERFAQLGHVLGTLAAIDWESESLASRNIRGRHFAVLMLEHYCDRLMDLERTLDMRE